MRISRLPAHHRHTFAPPIVAIVLCAATLGVHDASARPHAASPCAPSPVEAAATFIRIPARQLRAEVAGTARRTGRPAPDVLLERVELATLDQVYLLASADDRAGMPVAQAAAALLDRRTAVRAAVVAGADCLGADRSAPAAPRRF